MAADGEAFLLQPGQGDRDGRLPAGRWPGPGRRPWTGRGSPGGRAAGRPAASSGSGGRPGRPRPGTDGRGPPRRRGTGPRGAAVVPPRTTAPRPGRARLTARRSRRQLVEPRLPLARRGARRSRSSAGRAARRGRAGRGGPARRPARWRPGRAGPGRAGSTGRPRRSWTARLRRSSSGASSRKVNGRPLRISCASTDGSVVSRTTTVTRPDSIRLDQLRSGRRCPWPRAGSRPASGGRGGDRGSPAARAPRSPGRRPASGRPRPSGRRIPSAGWPAGSCVPPRIRSTARDRFRFHRHRAANIGEVSTACRTTPSTVLEARNFGTRSSGKLCCGPRDSKIASSLAAACSSKSKVTQNRLRSASPSARLSRAPNGACPTSCIPPVSSKNRSSTMVSMVGSTPSAASPAAR